MRCTLEFRSVRLLDPDTDERLPPGEKVARLLAERLPERGFTVPRVDSEDWGWLVRITNDAFPLWIGCGHHEEYADGHLCFIEPSKPFVRRWLKRIPTSEQVERLASAVDNVVRAEPDIHGVRWWTDAENVRG